MDKIIPRSIHYADLKPEAIEHQVRLVRFLAANSNASWTAGQTIPFKLQGNGFYDPYSAYLNIRFQFDIDGEFAYQSPTEPFLAACRFKIQTPSSKRFIEGGLITNDFIDTQSTAASLPVNASCI